MEYKIRLTIKSELRGLSSKGVIVHAYSTDIDLAPSDFYLFGPFKHVLRGKRFTNHYEVEKAVQQWLRGQPKELCGKRIKNLQERWDNCSSVYSDYVAK